jgi:uncharacterized protein YggT (Ycf19 family)
MVRIQDLVDLCIGDYENRRAALTSNMLFEPWGYSNQLDQALKNAGYPPLLFVVPAEATYLPGWINQLLLRFHAYDIKDFELTFEIWRLSVIFILKKFVTLMSIRYATGWFLQFNPYAYPYNFIMLLTQPVQGLFTGIFPVIAGVDFGTFFCMGIINQFIDGLKRLCNIAPYSPNDIGYDLELGKLIINTEDNFGWSFRKYENATAETIEIVRNERIKDMSVHIAGLPSLFVDHPNWISEMYKCRWWFGMYNSADIIPYLQETYPDINFKPLFILKQQRMIWLKEKIQTPFYEWLDTPDGLDAGSPVNLFDDYPTRIQQLTTASLKTSLLDNKTLLADATTSLEDNSLLHFKQLLFENLADIMMVFDFH